MARSERSEPPDWSRLIHAHRDRRKLSRRELAQRTGISGAAVKAFELGVRRPKEATLNAIIDALGLTREEANPIRSSLGYAEDWFALFHERYPSDPAELERQVNALRWPAFVTNQAFDLIYTNAAFERAMGVDLSQELLAPGERNFLAQASTPRFAAKFANFEDLVTYMVGLVKGDPRWNQTIARPAPWLQTAMQKFMTGDQALVQRVLHLWQETQPIPHRSRHLYTVRIREGDATRSFQASTSIADLWGELSWNEWVPLDTAR